MEFMSGDKGEIKFDANSASYWKWVAGVKVTIELLNRK